VQVAGGTDGTKLQLGDELISVDGTPVADQGVRELAELLRGEPRSMVELELRRGWAQVPIRTQLQRRGARREKPPRPPAPAAGVAGAARHAGGTSRESRDPSFRDLPAPPMPRELPLAPTSAAAVAAAARDRPPPPSDMGPLPVPGSRRPSPQSSVSSPGPGALDARGNSGAARRQASAGAAAQGSVEVVGRSPSFITPVGSQMSVGSQSGASTPGGGHSLVARLSRQVERLDAESKQHEHEKQELQAQLRERDARIVRIEGEMKQLRQGQRESVDVDILKELRGRVQALEEDVRRRDAELVERSEHIARLQRQLGATSAPGSAMSFLNDLLGAKDRYSEEAQRAKEEAELMKQRIEHVSQQNQDKERLIRDLEAARLSLSGKAQQDGQEAEELRERVKSLEGLLEAQLGSVMDQLVDAMHRNEELAADSRDTRAQLSSAQENARQLARQVEERESECTRTAAEVANARAEVGQARAARHDDALALRGGLAELVQVLQEAQTYVATLRTGCESSEARSAALAQVLSVCLSVCLPACLPACMCVCLCVCESVCLCLDPSLVPCVWIMCVSRYAGKRLRRYATYF